MHEHQPDEPDLTPFNPAPVPASTGDDLSMADKIKEVDRALYEAAISGNVQAAIKWSEKHARRKKNRKRRRKPPDGGQGDRSPVDDIIDLSKVAGRPTPANDSERPISITGSRSDMALVNMAQRHRWPITERIRNRVCEIAMDIAENSDKEGHQLGALKVLAQADAINVRRETNEVQERSTEIAIATGVMKEAMRSPEARQALADLSRTMLQPATPQTPEENHVPALPAPHINGEANGFAGSSTGY